MALPDVRNEYSLNIMLNITKIDIPDALIRYL